MRIPQSQTNSNGDTSKNGQIRADRAVSQREKQGEITPVKPPMSAPKTNRIAKKGNPPDFSEEKSTLLGGGNPNVCRRPGQSGAVAMSKQRKRKNPKSGRPRATPGSHLSETKRSRKNDGVKKTTRPRKKKAPFKDAELWSSLTEPQAKVLVALLVLLPPLLSWLSSILGNLVAKFSKCCF